MVSIKIDTGGTMFKQVMRTRFPSWITRGIVATNEEVGWFYNLQLTEVRFTQREDGWRIMVKAIGKDGPLVAYASADFYSDAIEVLAYEIQAGTLNFIPDKYPVKL